MRKLKYLASVAILAFPVLAHAGEAPGPTPPIPGVDTPPSGVDAEFVETGSTDASGSGDKWNVGNGLSGFVEAGGGYMSGKSGDYSADGTAWALRGSANASLERNINLQADAAYSSANAEGLDVNTLIGAAHAYYRQPDSYAVGAYIQGGRLGSSILDVASDVYGVDDSATTFIGGGEAAIYSDAATLHGKVGFGRASYSGLSADVVTAGLGARVYANENVRFDLDAGLARLSAYGGEVTSTTLSAIGNYRMASVPATVFAGYQYGNIGAEVAGADQGDVDTHTIMAGVRFSFGSKSLKDEERNGATWSATPGGSLLGL